MSTVAKYRSNGATKPFLNSLFDEFFNGSDAFAGATGSVFTYPATNILEKPEAFLIEMAVPGFDKKDFSVKVDRHLLVIEGKRETAQTNQQEQFTRREILQSSFRRSFNLPDSVNKDAVAAVYENGVLKISVPKSSEAQASTRTIEIG